MHETARLRAGLPAGLKLVQVASMPKAVGRSIDDFVEAVAEAIGIVLLVSLISLGFRTGMVVVISIPLVLAATALCMYLFHIGLHKVSLGTLILALGLLVDDAIIAVETMAVKLEQGFDRLHAAAFAYKSTAFPMLTGTLVTVSGFLPIALAKSGTGEYTRSIFEVSAIALLLSWLAAVIVIPLLGYRILSEHPTRRAFGFHRDAPSAAATAPGGDATPGRGAMPDGGAVPDGDAVPGGDAAHAEHHDVYDTKFYRRLRGWIGWCIDHRGLVLAVTLGMFVIGLAGFKLVPQQFFPSSDRPELLVDLRLPEGASFDATQREVRRFEGDAGESAGDRSFHRLRRSGRTPLLSAARSTARRAELRAVRGDGEERQGPGAARHSPERGAAHAVFIDPHPHQQARERSAGRFPGAIPGQRSRDRHRQAAGGKGRRGHAAQPGYRQRAVRLG